MNCQKAIENLKKNGFSVQYFENRQQACDYLKEQLKDEVIGFGGSMTSKELGLYELLGENNTVYWHWLNIADIKRYPEFTVYITSANAIAETGELVNIDATGNRLAATLFGPKKVYFVCGKNKITADLPSAIDRARNVAAPINAKRLGRKTPCVVTGKCENCSSPERICNGISVHLHPMGSIKMTEVILIGEDLGA